MRSGLRAGDLNNPLNVSQKPNSALPDAAMGPFRMKRKMRTDLSSVDPAGTWAWRLVLPAAAARGGGGGCAATRGGGGAAARARYPAPTVGLPPWYRFATNGLLLRYIAGGGVRYMSTASAAGGSRKLAWFVGLQTGRRSTLT